MLIDVDVATGHWPFQRLAFSDLPDLAGLLTGTGIQQALVWAVETALAPDPDQYNVPLLAELAAEGPLWPVPVVDPSLPGWQDRLSAYRRHPRVRAIKILPNYHRYSLDHPAVDELADILVEEDVPLFVQMRVEDERNQYPALRIAGVDAAEASALAQRRPALRMACLCPYLQEALDLVAAADNVWIDLAMAETLDTLIHLLEHVPAERVLFGSHTPFLYTGAALAKLRDGEVPASARAAVAGTNAEALLRPVARVPEERCP